MTKRKWLKHVPAILTVLILVLAVSGAFFLKSWLFSDKVEPKKQVQKITVINPPKPPPPPEQEPPPPEEVEEMVEEEEMPEDVPDESPEPPAQDLGMDAEGVAGGDNFGLVGRPGGRGLFGGGGGYGSLVERELDELLQRDRKLRGKVYYFIVDLRLNRSGRIEGFEIIQKRGDESLKAYLESKLMEFARFSEPVPLEANNRFRLELESSRT